MVTAMRRLAHNKIGLRPLFPLKPSRFTLRCHKRGTRSAPELKRTARICSANHSRSEAAAMASISTTNSGRAKPSHHYQRRRRQGPRKLPVA